MKQIKPHTLECVREQMRERANATRYTPNAVNVHRAGAMWEIASLFVDYQRSWSAQSIAGKVQTPNQAKKTQSGQGCRLLRVRVGHRLSTVEQPHRWACIASTCTTCYTYLPTRNNKLSYPCTCAPGGARDVHKCIALNLFVVQ